MHLPIRSRSNEVDRDVVLGAAKPAVRRDVPVRFPFRCALGPPSMDRAKFNLCASLARFAASANRLARRSATYSPTYVFGAQLAVRAHPGRREIPARRIQFFGTGTVAAPEDEAVFEPVTKFATLIAVAGVRVEPINVPMTAMLDGRHVLFLRCENWGPGIRFLGVALLVLSFGLRFVLAFILGVGVTPLVRQKTDPGNLRDGFAWCPRMPHRFFADARTEIAINRGAISIGYRDFFPSSGFKACCYRQESGAAA